MKHALPGGLALAALLAASAPALAQPTGSRDPLLNQGPKAVATSDGGMVATQLPNVTRAAVRVLEDGGNAVDAFVTAVFLQHVEDYHQVSHFGAMSGETEPPSDIEPLSGTDASHAWFSVYLPQLGWVDFDPTNNQVPTDQHITVAWGRDYSDVTPLKGVVFGSGAHELFVSVDCQREAEA